MLATACLALGHRVERDRVAGVAEQKDLALLLEHVVRLLRRQVEPVLVDDLLAVLDPQGEKGSGDAFEYFDQARVFAVRGLPSFRGKNDGIDHRLEGRLDLLLCPHGIPPVSFGLSPGYSWQNLRSYLGVVTPALFL